MGCLVLPESSKAQQHLPGRPIRLALKPRITRMSNFRPRRARPAVVTRVDARHVRRGSEVCAATRRTSPVELLFRDELVVKIQRAARRAGYPFTRSGSAPPDLPERSKKPVA